MLTCRQLAALLALAAVNVLLLLPGRGQKDRSSHCQPAVPGIRHRVGLVFDVGGIGDKSFNDAAHRGLVRAHRALGVGICYIEPGDGSDRESAVRKFASEGYDLVIGVGFVFTDDLIRLAAEFPHIHFAGVDFSAEGKAPMAANLIGLRFREHEGSFLVGALAGLTTASKRVGFVGGMKIPLIRKFEVGYRAGVAHVCGQCVVLSAYAGTEPRAFADPTTGHELAATQYDRGADIIYHASGKTGAGVFRAAVERGKWVIGVDSDQFDEAPCCVLTSMIKRVDVAVFDVIRATVAGVFRPGVRELGLAEQGVGFVYDDRNRDRLAAAAVDRVRRLGKDIVAGVIEVPWQ